MACHGPTHTAWAGVSWSYAMAALILCLGEAAVCSDTDSMVCYKPPPPTPTTMLPANDIATHQELFFYHSVLDISKLPGVRVTYQHISLSISDTCGVDLDIVYRITVFVVSDIFMECKYVNKSSPPQTPLPTSIIRFVYHDQSSQESTVAGTLSFERICASDPVIQLTCQMKLPGDIGGILDDFFFRFNILLRLLGCPHATHGAKCNQACACAQGVECHPFNGQCVCPRGLQGEICDRANPLLSRPGPATVFVPIGQSVTLTCIGYGMTHLLSGWERNGTRLDTQTGAEAVPYSPRPFFVNTTIVAASADVNGVYRCTIKDADQSKKVHMYTATVELIVTNIPQPFLEVPSNQSVPLGSRVELRCSTKPEAGVQTWAWPGARNQTLAPVADNDSGSSGESKQQSASEENPVGDRGGNRTTSVLTLARARFEDAGMYRCIVGHPGANDSAVSTAWLTVESQGSAPSISLLGDAREIASWPVIQTREGALLTVGCEVLEAHPAPSVAWYVGKQDRTRKAATLTRTSLNGVSYDANSSLALQPSWHDNGKRVACVSVVTNFPPLQSEELQLDVLYVPKVSVTPSEKTVQPGQSPEFSCRAEANPSPPDDKYQWTLRRRDGQVIRHYRGRSVRIKNVKPHLNMATLTCNVSNALGWNSSKAVIKVFRDIDPSHLEGSWSVVMVTVLVILVVLTVAVPVLVYRHRGRLHDHFFKHRTKPDLKGKEHDVFVAYKGGGEEEVFVNTQLVPKLMGWGCEVCIDYKNFLPGREIVDNIMAAVTSSRKTLLVLSPDFMASEWCYFEFMCAVAEGLQRQTTSVIPLMFCDIRGGELCASMQTLLDTVSFIPWPAERPHESAAVITAEFWTLLRRAVETEYNVTGLLEEDADNNNDDDDGNDHIILI